VTVSRRVGLALAALIALVAAGAPIIAPHDPWTQFADLQYAPPMLPRVVDARQLRAPFIYPVRLVDRLERRFEEDRSRRIPLRWFAGGRLLTTGDPATPWLLLGGDALGRDVFARVLGGARLSLGVALLATASALLLGALIGALAGYAGGTIDAALMRVADFVIILPVIYVVLALRAVMPLVLTPAQVFWTLALVMALAGWPYAARGVRAVIAAERRKEYAEAARAIGAGGVRILLRHLLPAAGGFVAVQATLLLPAFIVAEATLSFVGLGFPDTRPSWGVMLPAPAETHALFGAPWLLAPAAAIVVTVFALHLLSARRNPVEDRARAFL
jgi:peptide/nickel transport system permease protein